MSKTGYNYCAELVKRNDEDRYLSTLFAPNKKRPALFALYAFSFEVSQTRERVSEPMLGEIRLQWWREAIEGLFGGAPRKHEVIEALASVMEQSPLPRMLFDSLIDAHSLDLEDDPVATVEDLLAYASACSSHVMKLAAFVLIGGEPCESLDKAAQSAGLAWALTGLIRALPVHAARGQSYIPKDIQSRHNVSIEELYVGLWNDRLEGAFREMIDLARVWLEEARFDLKQVPDVALPAFLPLSLCGSYLRGVSRPGFDPFRQTTDLTLLGRQYRMIKAMVTRRF